MHGVDTMILPPKSLPAIKNHNQHALSLAQALHDNVPMDATAGDIAVSNDMEIDLVTKNINPKMAEEADSHFGTLLGVLPDCKTLNAFDISEKLVFNISTRLFVGPKHCRDAKYTAVCKGCMESAFPYGVMWNFPPVGRWRNWWYWLASFKFRPNVRSASESLIPTPQERTALRDSGAVEKDKPIDVLQFALDQPIPSTRENGTRRHSLRVVRLTLAGTGTVITLLYRLMYLIFLFPQYLEPLRNEIAPVLPKDGAFGDVKKLKSLTLPDSFIRETMRFYPAACFFGARTGREEVVLEEMGLEPKSGIAFPTAGINMDAENHKDALTFEGFRFAG